MSTLVSLNSPLTAQGGAIQVVEPTSIEEATVESVNTPIPLEIEEGNEEDSSENIFQQGVNVTQLKKYYKWLARRLVVWSIVVWLVFLTVALFAHQFCCTIWTIPGEFSPFKTWFQSAKTKIKDNPTKGALTVIIICALILFFRNISRLSKRRKSVAEENDLCKSKFYPSYLTPACTCNIISLFQWRFNLFWLGFGFIGLGVNAIVAANIIAGVKKVLGESGMDKENSYWGFKWHTFLGQWWRADGTFSYYVDRIVHWTTGAGWGKEKYHDSIAAMGLWGIKGGLSTILLTNPLLKFFIKKALAVFNMNEFNMGAELRDRAYQINKRNKIICLIFLCLSGLEIYIVLRRLIIAVFNKSFKFSKR